MQVIVPFFDLQAKEFVCFCKGKRFAYSTQSKYLGHCKTQLHREWCSKFHVNDNLEPISCSECLQFVNSLVDHEEKCIIKRLERKSLDYYFESKIKEVNLKQISCYYCNVCFYQTTMGNVREWKSKKMCSGCYKKYHQYEKQIHLTLLRIHLLKDCDFLCVLCRKSLSLDEQLIFEHINPFEKIEEEQPYAMISRGDSVSSTLVSCKRQGVKIVHLFCAQLKTELEREMNYLQMKSNLTRLKKRKLLCEKGEMQTEFYRNHYQGNFFPKLNNAIAFFVKKQNYRRRIRSRSADSVLIRS